MEIDAHQKRDNLNGVEEERMGAHALSGIFNFPLYPPIIYPLLLN